MQSLSEQFYQLRKYIGIHNVNAQMDISATGYRSTKFVIGIVTEKMLGANFSGYNSKANDLTVLRLKPLGDATFVGAGNCKLHYVLHYDCIMQIQDSGIGVLE